MTDTENTTDKQQFDNVEDVNFTYATHTDPQRQVDRHGIYLDDVNRQRAEVQRAKVEGREPDLKNPPATTGDVLKQTEVLKKDLPGDFRVPVSKSLPVDLTEDGVGTANQYPPDSPIVDESNSQTVSDASTGQFVQDEQNDNKVGESGLTSGSLPPVPTTE